MGRSNRPPYGWQMLGKSNGQEIAPGNSYDKFNHLMTAEYSPIIELKPLPSVDFIRNMVNPVGTTNISVVNGEIQIDGTTELTSLYTRDYGRYLPGLVAIAGIGVRVPNPNVGLYQFGYGNNSGNRFGIEIENGEWYTFIESSGIRYYRNPRSNWLDPLDGTGPSGLDIELTDFVLRLPFGWYGYLSIDFVIAFADRERGDQAITVDMSGHRTGGVSIEQPNLPIFASAQNGVMYVGGRQFGIYGRYRPQFRTSATPPITKTVGTTYEPIASISPKTATQWRGIPINILVADVITTDSVEYAVIFHETGNLTGAIWEALPDTGVNNTALEYDSTATAIGAGEVYKMYGGILVDAKGNDANADKENVPDVNIPFGVSVTVLARTIMGATTADVTTMIKMQEEW